MGHQSWCLAALGWLSGAQVHWYTGTAVALAGALAHQSAWDLSVCLLRGADRRLYTTLPSAQGPAFLLLDLVVH
jgi:hypothetical protein